MQILKVGGSVISKKHGYMEENERAIEALAAMLSNVWKQGKKDLVLIHGAGSFGHAPVIMHGVRKEVKSASVPFVVILPPPPKKKLYFPLFPLTPLFPVEIEKRWWGLNDLLF